MKRNSTETLTGAPDLAEVYRKHGYGLRILASKESIPHRRVKTEILELTGLSPQIIQQLRAYALMPCLSDTIPNHSLRREIQNELGTDHPAIANDALRVANLFATGLFLESILNCDQVDERIKSEIRKVIAFAQRWLNQENTYYKLSKNRKISKVRSFQKKVGQIYLLLTE